MIELGQEAKDKVTGFIGIITARYQYITGCDQYCLVPKEVKGELKDAHSFDEGRIEIIGPGINPKKVTGRIKGGPQRDAPASHK